MTIIASALILGCHLLLCCFYDRICATMLLGLAKRHWANKLTPNGSLVTVSTYTTRRYTREIPRAVASLTVPGGQEFHFPHSFLKFRSIFLTFPQTFLIFFLILAPRVGDSPTRKGPGYATGDPRSHNHIPPLCFIFNSTLEQYCAIMGLKQHFRSKLLP